MKIGDKVYHLYGKIEGSIYKIYDENKFAVKFEGIERSLVYYKKDIGYYINFKDKKIKTHPLTNIFK